MPLTFLAALAMYARFLHRTWLHPAAFPLLVWSGFIAASLVLAPDYQVSGLAVWAILGFTLAAYLGAALAGKQEFHSEPGTKVEGIARARLLLWVLLFSCAAMGGVIWFTAGKLAEYDLSPSWSGLLALGHLVSVDRYSGIQEPLVVRVLWMWIFPAAVLGGVTFAVANSRLQKYLSLAAIVPALANGFVETTRASVLIPICCWLGGFFSIKIYTVGCGYRLFNRQTVTVAAVLVVLLASVFLSLDALRVFTPEKDFAVEADNARVKAYSLGSLSFFSNWLDREQTSAAVTFGGQTFRSLFELLGLEERKTTPELSFADGGVTNIPTAFASLIQDFTFPGAFFVCLLTGYAGGRAFGRIKQGDLTLGAALAAYYTLVLFSPVTSLTNYNGPILGWVLTFFILRSVRKRCSGQSLLTVEESTL